AGPWAIDQGEYTGMQPGFPHGCGDGLSDQLSGARMCIMRFEDHWASRGKRRGGVPARCGERQRKVAGAEYPDRAQRDRALTDIQPRLWGTLWHRRIDARPVMVSLAHDSREESQLIRRTCQFPA